MDRWVVLIVTVVLVVGVVGSSAQAKYGGGSGTAEDPYLIYTASQMNAIGADANDWDKHFKLMADVDLGGYVGDQFNIGNYTTPFTGVFDGNGHTISNFTYTSADTNYIGLFGYVTGEIKDLGLIAPDVDAGTGVGSLAGYLKQGTVTNCYAEGGSVVGGDWAIGGLVGYNWDGSITNSYATGSVSGDWRVGGLVGFNAGTISNSYATGDVSGVDDVGGLAGQNWDESITNSYSTGSVSGNERVGGLVGYNALGNGTITNCYSEGVVSGVDDVGGLMGSNEGTITNCYSAGGVSGDYEVGGLVGFRSHWQGEVINSFWDIQTSGQTTSTGGRGKTTVEMQTASTFLGWAACGNEGIWTIDEGKDYPRLWWEYKPGEALHTQQLSDFLTGAGTQDDPYLIYTAEQLNVIGVFPCEWNKHFKLMADIDLSAFTGTSFNVIGTGWRNPFIGVFDGNGHTISNFTYDSNDTNYIGLFGEVDDPNAEIKDLGLINPDVDAGAGDVVGSLVGLLEGGTISNCYVEGGSVSGNSSVGGLLGYNWDGSISNSYATGSVSGDWRVGGLVGFDAGTITNCYSTGSVSGTTDVGGLVGDNWDESITTSYATGSVSGDKRVGGLVGSNEGTITNCYSTGSVSGNKNVGPVGGLVGDNEGTISNCYAAGSVTGDWRVGGLTGYNGCTITNCYSTGSVTGGDAVGGLVGFNYFVLTEVTGCFWDIQTSGQATSDGGTGKTTAEMQTMSTFTDAGWDFVGETINGTEDIWRLSVDGTSYPQLNWQFPLGDFVPPDGYVDYWDLLYFAQRWHTSPSDTNWDPRCDLAKEDNYVDYWDLLVFAQQWHKGVRPE